MRIWINHYEGPGSKLKTTAINTSAKVTVRELKCIVAEKLRKIVNSFYLVYVKNGSKVLLTETFTLKFFDMKRVSVVTVVDICKKESKDIPNIKTNAIPDPVPESEIQSSIIVFSTLVSQAVDTISARNSIESRVSYKSVIDQGDKQSEDGKDQGDKKPEDGKDQGHKQPVHGIDQPRSSYQKLQMNNKSDQKPKASPKPTFEKLEKVEKRVLDEPKKRDQCNVRDCCILI